MRFYLAPASPPARGWVAKPEMERRAQASIMRATRQPQAQAVQTIRPGCVRTARRPIMNVLDRTEERRIEHATAGAITTVSTTCIAVNQARIGDCLAATRKAWGIRRAPLSPLGLRRTSGLDAAVGERK